MFYQFFSYIKFLLKSQNQHGLHSPFVYNFVTKGLYIKVDKNNKLEHHSTFKNLPKKKKIILFKIINYFKINIIEFEINNTTKTLDKSHKKLYINNIDEFKKINFIDFNPSYFIIVDKIHHNKKSFETWQKIIENKEATVTIDLFYFGLIFFRKEQAKEHFIIRV